jgi:hypothetical protein
MPTSYEDIMNAIDFSTTLTGGDGSGSAGIQDFLGNLGLLGGLAQGIGGTAAVTGAYNRLGSIGEAAQQGALGIAQAGLDQTQFQPYGVTTTTGSTFGYDPVTEQLTLTSSDTEDLLQQQLFSDAKSMFTDAAGDTGEREQAVYERLRAAQRPEEERQRQALEERLQNQGRLGVRTSMFGGTPEQLALSKAQAEAQNTAMLRAMQQAQAEQAQQAALGQQMLGASYMPQAQLLQAMQGTELYPQLQQKGQLTGAGLFGEASMGGLEALLGAGLGQANLMGQLGTGLLSGLATPTDSYGGLADVIGVGTDIYDQLFGAGGLFG